MENTETVKTTGWIKKGSEWVYVMTEGEKQQYRKWQEWAAKKKKKDKITDCILASIGFLLFGIVCFLFISGLRDTERIKEKISIPLVVKYVNLTQYSNRKGLDATVYLETEKEELLEVYGLRIYEELKTHIGQTVYMSGLKTTCVSKKTGEVLDKKVKISRPYTVLKIDGEEQAYEDVIDNVEVRRYFSFIPIFR